PIRRVYARARAVAVPAPLADAVAALFETEAGVAGTMVSNYCTPARFVYHVAGTEGALDATPHAARFTPRSGAGSPDAVDLAGRPFDAYERQFAAFAEAVRAGAAPETDGVAGLRALAVVEAMQRSAETGRAEDVEAP